MNVLLVDDEPFELEMLEMIIRPLCPAWNFYTAIDSSRALALSRQVKQDLALLDINLPGMSGLELAKVLREEQPNIDIVIITAYQDFHHVRQCVRIGVLEYLTKPIIENELTEILCKYRVSSHHVEYSTLIQKVLRILSDRYTEKMSLADIAGEIYVNASYLSRRFSEEVGLPFSEYLINYRVEKAKTILATHMDWSISKVSEVTGFNSQHYFSTLFHKKTGMTPREYREMGR